MRLRSLAVVLALFAPAPASPAGAVGAVPPSPPVTAPSLFDVQGYGDARFYGATFVAGNQPVVGIARTPSSHGYWQAAVDGGVFASGDARFYGSMGGTHLNQPVVGIGATPTGKGYWLVANDGGVFSFGDARFYGSMGGTHLNQPVVGIAATPTGKGYWLVADDGGVFSFGDARFLGSMGNVRLAQPVVGIAASATGAGYYLVASDGGVFTFGNARFHGTSDPAIDPGPVVGIAVRPNRDGYWLVTAAGHVVSVGHAPVLPDARSVDITKPIVGIAATRSGNGYWLAGRGTVPVYFLRGERLGAATRDVHAGAGGLTAATDGAVNVVRDLLSGPTATERAAGLSTAIPAGTTVNDLSVAHGVVTVDLSAQFVTGGGSLSMQERVAQVVSTLTGLPDIDRVSFSIAGKHVTTIGGEGLIVDPPVTRATFSSFFPQVLIDTPGPGDLVTSPLVITGSIDSFEGGATFELRAADGRVLATGIGQGAMGFRLQFASALAFESGGAAAGTLTARPSSGIEGTPPADAVIPVRFH